MIPEMGPETHTGHHTCREDLVNNLHKHIHITLQDGHKVGEKIYSSFPGFFRAINLLVHRSLQEKVNVIITFITGHSTSTNNYWAGSLLPDILMILFTQSTAVIDKYLNDELKILRLLQFFPEVAQNSMRIP